MALDLRGTAPSSPTHAARLTDVDVRSPVVVSSNGVAPNTTYTGGGAVAPGVTTLSSYTIPEAVTDLRIVIPNWTWVATTTKETPVGNQVTFKAAIQYQGTTYPIYFGTTRSVTVDDGTTIVSEPVSLILPAGATIGIRMLTSVATSALKWPNDALGGGPGVTNLGDGYVLGDAVDSGTIGTAGSVAAPMIILGTPLGAPLPRIAAIGDSIMAGLGDTGQSVGYGQVGPNSWLTRGIASTLPMFRFAGGSDLAMNWAAAGGAVQIRRGRFFRGMSRAVIALGTNDLSGVNSVSARTFAQLQADITTIVSQLNSRGIPSSKIWIATLPPRTTSTDSFATTANQTVVASESKRVAYNTWVRGVPLGIAGCIDVAAQVETALNSGIWKATGSAQGYTEDGIHPNATGHTAMAAAVPVSAISS